MNDIIENNLEETENENNEGQGQGQNENDETVTMSKAELETLIQQMSDKRVTQAQKTFEKKLQKEKSLAGLDAESRAKQEAEDRINELTEQLEGYKLSATKAEISKVLGERNLDVNLVDFVVTSSDNEECLKKIETLEKIFKKMVTNEVTKKIGANSFKSSTISKGMTKDEFAKLSIAEQAKIYETDKELYNQLTQM